MPAQDSDLDLSLVEATLRPCRTRWLLESRDQCTSTNSVLMDEAESGAPHGRVLVCNRQTAGRGRRGRRWQSVPGGSLTFSLLWRFAAGARPPSGLSLAIGLALVRALEGLGVQGVRLKWPNDLLVGGGKIAGILVELLPARERAPAAIVGIGLNLTLPADFAVDPGLPVRDLASLLAEVPSREALLAETLRSVDVIMARFESEGFAALRAEWISCQAYRGEAVRVVTDDGAATEGLCVGVDDDGALLVETSDGTRRMLTGEPSLRAAR